MNKYVFNCHFTVLHDRLFYMECAKRTEKRYCYITSKIRKGSININYIKHTNDYRVYDEGCVLELKMFAIIINSKYLLLVWKACYACYAVYGFC